MERCLLNQLSDEVQFVCSRMLRLNAPYDALESDLLRVAGIKFKQLDEILQKASEQIGIQNFVYLVLSDYDAPENVHIVIPMANRGRWIHQLAIEMRRILPQYSYARLALLHHTVSDAIKPWKLQRLYGFTTLSYKYSIKISL